MRRQIVISAKECLHYGTHWVSEYLIWPAFSVTYMNGYSLQEHLTWCFNKKMGL